MSFRNGLCAALVAAGVIATAPAWACDTGRSASDTPRETEVTARPTNDSAIGHSDVLEGQVAAIDHQSGRLILDTDFGLLHLLAEPAELEGVQEGDVIQVALTE
jgi:hypothetical protein